MRADLATVLSGFAGLTLLASPLALKADVNHPGIGLEAARHLPLFDAHVHYNREAWEAFPPDAVLSLMDRNGVMLALVSSSPDDGTITLWQHAPNRIVPEVRPYNNRLGQYNWTKGKDVAGFIESRLREYPHRGIGEFHLHRVYVEDTPLLKRIVAMAVARDIPLHVHSGYQPVEYLYSLNPALTIIWAHAGMSDPPKVVESMMERYATLYADTSYRETDILTVEGIDQDWRRVLERFSDRFMVGSDTWTNSQWIDYDGLIALNRQWLAFLSPQAARRIAYQNAERLFGIKVDPNLLGTR